MRFPRLKWFSSCLITVLVVVVLLPVIETKLAGSTKRHIAVLNESQSKVGIYWVHPDTGETVSMGEDMMPGGEFPIDSYVGHEFQAVEMPNKSGVCPLAPDQVCRVSHFTTSENDNQVVRITENIEAVFTDNQIVAQMQAGDIVAQCKAKATSKAAASGDFSSVLESLMSCVEGGVAQSLEKVQEEISFQASVRTEIAGMLENYTCLDDSLESTEDIELRSWKHLDEEPRVVHVKHERPASRIHMIEKFILPDECEAMEQAAQDFLHRATVADGKGGSRLSENRKAMQAGITVPWDEESQGHPIARLSRRVYDYTNHVLGLGIREHGQEDLMSIQYFGRGLNDTQPDRYTPHCDGDCTGQPHKIGTRMATLVMYCDIASKGGHTNFRNAGVHIKPTMGAGIFFSYIDPETRIMDTGYTEHSGCPVFEGEKKIVTQWVRLGVDAENPWDSFNTLGIKKSDLIYD